MTKISSLKIYSKIRLSHSLNLIFFALLFTISCQEENKTITIGWQDKKAISISVPEALLKNFKLDSVDELLNIRLEHSTTAILGEYREEDNAIVFTPVIPFSEGAQYQVVFRNALIGKVDVPRDSHAAPPALLAIFPSTDTLPENLLKLYFQFSAPMREGECLQHIALLNAAQDTLPGIFLDLQPELWNKERTVLTLWLDPGRIKRDLIPNRKMGNPLQKGDRYTLVVAAGWKDVRGVPLTESHKRTFVVGDRDSISPKPQSWRLILPDVATVHPLKVVSAEPLDYFLLNESIQVIDNKNNRVDGRIAVEDKEKSFSFVPVQPWQPGEYRMVVDSRLEDLAGNNLERLFDRDIQAPQVATDTSLWVRKFVIEKR